MPTLEEFKDYVDQEAAERLEELYSIDSSTWARSERCQELLEGIGEHVRVLALVDKFQAAASAARGYGGCAPHGDRV